MWHSVMEEIDFLSPAEASQQARLWQQCVKLLVIDPREADDLASSRGSRTFLCRWFGDDEDDLATGMLHHSRGATLPPNAVSEPTTAASMDNQSLFVVGRTCDLAGSPPKDGGASRSTAEDVQIKAFPAVHSFSEISKRASRRKVTFEDGKPEVLTFCPGSRLQPHVRPCNPSQAPAGIAKPVRRPSMLSYTLAGQIELLPCTLTGPLPDQPIGDLGAICAGPTHTGRHHYTICEPRQNLYHRQADTDWSPQDYLADAAASVHYIARSAQFLLRPLRAEPSPQIVLTPVWAERSQLSVPVDLRNRQGQVCTVLAAVGDTPERIAGLVAAQGCAFSPGLYAELTAGLIQLKAADGSTVISLAAPLEQYEWLEFCDATPVVQDEGTSMMQIAANVHRCVLPCHRKGGSLSDPTVDSCASMQVEIANTSSSQPCHWKVGALSEPTVDHCQRSPSATCVFPAVAHFSSFSDRAAHATTAPEAPSRLYEGDEEPLPDKGSKVGTPSNLALLQPRPPIPGNHTLAHQGRVQPSSPVPRAHPGDPPSLLFAGGALQPKLPRKPGEGELQVLPSSLHSQGRLTLSAAQLRLCQAADPSGIGEGKYSVFDRHRHHEVRKSTLTWSASDYLSDAVTSCAEATICAQFLQPPIPDLPVPQITLTPPGWSLGAMAVAIDTRKVGGTICTVVLPPGCEKATVLEAVVAACPLLTAVLHFASAQDAIFLLDSAGRIWDVLPMQLDTLQWLSLQLDTTGMSGAHSDLFLGGLIGAGQTTLTSTAAVARGSASTPPTVTFILVGGGTLIRLAPQPWMHANVLDSLTELLFVLALQGRVPHRPLLQISAASPRVPARLNTYFICFLIYPEGPDIHVLEDFSVDGSLLQGFSVDEGTRPVHLLSEAHARRGFAAYINGLAHTAANRELATGDLIQIRQGDYFAEVETPSRLYELLPHLRYFALPIPVPHMQALAADPLSATLQTRTKAALRRTLQLRIDDRQQHFGSFARGNQPIVVLGPGHPALSLYMDQPLTPGFAEAVEFLQNGEYLPAGTTFRDPLVLEWTTPVFISVPPGSTRRTLLYPSPHSPHFLQVSVPPNLPLAGLPLPVRRGRHAVFPPHTESEHVIEEKPIPQDRRPSVDTTSGTSLLQVSKQLRQVRIPTPLGQRAIRVPGSAATDRTRTQIELACAVPEPEAGAAWGVNREVAGDAFQAHLLPLPDLVPRARGLLPVARHTWNLLGPPCPAEHLDAVLIYTDGSFDPKARCASWSFVAVGKQGATLCRLGALAGKVLEPADTVNAFRAEIWALLQAAAFAIANNLRQVTFAVDCQAAMDVAFGRAQAQAQDHIGLAVQSLFFLARATGLQVQPRKVEAHSGIPLNEAADAVAKTANGCWTADGFSFDDSALRSCIEDGTIHRLWLASYTAKSSVQLPALDDRGCWSLPSCRLLPTTEAATSTIRSDIAEPKTWRLAFHAITYNCLSARSRPARALIDAGLQGKQCAIAGLQEARDPNTGISASEHYWIATSGCDAQGSFGCQIWISKITAWGHSSEIALKPVRESFSLFHAEPRLLVLLIRVGRVKFACVSAHAPTTAAGPEASRRWWAHLRAVCNGIPPGHTLLLMVDANAAYDRSEPSGDTLAAVPSSENAKQLQQFCDSSALQPTAQVDQQGNRLTSWTSPDGQTQKLLDYVCVPAAWRTRLSTAPNFSLGDLREGYDHSPIMGSVAATVCAPSPDARPRFPAEALRTAEGQRVAAAALASAPPVPWEVDATTHLDALLSHVQRFLKKHLPPAPPRPRNPVLSDLSLRLILTRRQVRTVKQRLEKAYARGLLYNCFAAWGGQAAQARSQAGRLDRLSNRLARAGFALSALHKGIGESFRADKAQFARRAMETARGRGAADFAHSIRAILRTGRRFRAPQLLHQISDGTSTAACEESILALLGAHFAKPERARQLNGTALLELFNDALPPTCKIDMTSLPSVAEITSATLALKKGKAPGVSGVPAELFQADAFATAELLFPILAKCALRCRGPLQHNGGLARAIPKGKQQAGTPAGWRSILLLEPTGKILQKAYRTQLVLALEQHKSRNQFGGLPHRRLEEPSVMVRAHFARLKAHSQTGGALFIDSKAAYYSLVRDSLVMSQTLQTEDQLRQRAKALFPFRDDQDHYVRHMRSGGLIQALQLPDPLIRYLESQLGTTWFCMEAPSSAPYISGSGTAPGSPIADLLFSFVYARFLQHVEEILLAEGHYVALCSTADASIMPTWADDTAVLVGPVVPHMLATSLQRVTDLVTRGLGRAGLDPNFGPGKTEAVIHFAGPGSRAVRKQLLCLTEPGVHFDSHLRGVQCLRLVPTYVHLGTVVSHNLSEEPNLSHRAQLLKQLFLPLRRRLLYNEDLTRQEKVRLLEERVFPKFLFGAGFWTPRSTREHELTTDPLKCAMRQAFRPITGISSAGYSNQEVAAALGLPTAEDCVVQARATTLLHLLKNGSQEVWTGLMSDGLWYRLSWEALRTVVGEAWPVTLCTADPPPPKQLWSQLPNHCAKLCREYLRLCKQRHPHVALQPRDLDACEAPAVTQTNHPELTHTCDTCGLAFLDARRLAVHRARKHKKRAIGFQLAWGTRCERCGTEYWHTSRLAQHLQHTDTCQRVYDHSDMQPDCAEAPGRVPLAWQPAVRTAGPMPFWAHLTPG